MATKVGESAGEMFGAITEFQTTMSDYTQGPLNKGWRAMILVNRAKFGNIPDPPKKTTQYPPTQDFTQEGQEIYQDKSKYEAKKHNSIIIVNTNVSPVVSVVLQNRPSSIQVNPTTFWTSVKSMGRNNPFMMYTGGEDSIQLEVSWYVDDPHHRDEVLNKVRLLESWSKADGYNAAPPTLKISWGESGIFDNDIFILESAPYVLSNFQSYQRQYQRGKSHSRPTTNIGLLPQCATQTLTFKRVTANNRTHAEIVPMEYLETTNGIKIGG